jgi:hypothetical protein
MAESLMKNACKDLLFNVLSSMPDHHGALKVAGIASLVSDRTVFVDPELVYPSEVNRRRAFVAAIASINQLSQTLCRRPLLTVRRDDAGDIRFSSRAYAGPLGDAGSALECQAVRTLVVGAGQTGEERMTAFLHHLRRVGLYPAGGVS